MNVTEFVCQCVECGRKFISNFDTEYCEICEEYLKEQEVFVKFKKNSDK